MRQRGFALLTFLPYIIGGLAVAGLLGWLAWQWSAFKEGLREEGRAEVRAEWAAERAQLIAARDAMIMRWAKAIQEVERVYITKVEWRTRTFVEYRERAAGAEVSGTITLSPGAVSVLADSAGAANDPGPAAGGEGTAAPVPEPAGDTATEAREWVEFAVEAAAAYADARDKWQACVSWAGEIQSIQQAPSNQQATE